MRDTFQKEPEVSITTTITRLASNLKEAADAHHLYEKVLGHPDPDWPIWYATFIDLQHHSVLVPDGQGGYRGRNQAELIEATRAYFTPLPANEADALSAGQGVVEEGKERAKAHTACLEASTLYDSLNNAFQAGAREMEERMDRARGERWNVENGLSSLDPQS